MNRMRTFRAMLAEAHVDRVMIDEISVGDGEDGEGGRTCGSPSNPTDTVHARLRMTNDSTPW